MSSPALNSGSIQTQLQQQGFAHPLDLHVLESIDSTNTFLKKQPTSPLSPFSCCVAETQTAGRGRFGRPWHSPFGENIYCSIRTRLNTSYNALSGLSLVVSLAVLTVLNNRNIVEGIRIKWPNDLLWHKKKLCGTLIEIVNHKPPEIDVIIGIGLNVNAIFPPSPDPNKPWCSLIDITGTVLDRNALIAEIIHQLHQDLNQLLNHGLNSFMSRWDKADYLKNQTIAVSHHTHIIEGQALGINEHGQLLLRDNAGEIHTLSSGDTSLLRR